MRVQCVPLSPHPLEWPGNEANVHVAGFVILHACARGKAISCIIIVIVVVVSTYLEI